MWFGSNVFNFSATPDLLMICLGQLLSLFINYTKLQGYHLCREEKMAAILALYTCGTLRPFRRPTTLTFCSRSKVMLMDMTAPGYDVAGSTPFFMDLLREPILHLARHPNNVSYKKFRDAKEGIGAIPEQSHKTKKCGCLETSMGNNVDAKLYASVCIPREFLQPSTVSEPYANQLETLNMASQRFLNTSITFVGVLSDIGTTVPRMIRRSSLAKTEREEIMDFKALGAELDFRSKPEALKAVLHFLIPI
jgi:hypothetical protein